MKISNETKQIASLKTFRHAGLFLLLIHLVISCSTGRKVNSSAGPVIGHGDTLSILTYNIHHANPPSKPGLIDVDAIAAVIVKLRPDVVALQEVDVYTNRSGKKHARGKSHCRKNRYEFLFC